MMNLIDFKGRLVVTRDEGTRLGVTSGLVIDEAVGRISALIFHPKWSTNERWVRTSDVVVVGADLVVISSEHKVQDGEHAGRRLADYRGRWVTTISGDHLGRLANVGTEGDDWSVHRLEFDDGSSVEVEAAEMVFGRDEILAPDHYEESVVAASKPSLGERIRGLFVRDEDAMTDSSATEATAGDVPSGDAKDPALEHAARGKQREGS